MSRDDIKSNPFDVINQLGFEIARALVFYTERYRNSSVLIDDGMKSCETYLKIIKKQEEILDSLSDDEVDFLRKTAHTSIIGTQKLNDELLSFYNKFNTEYSESNPFVSVEFEEKIYSAEKCKHLKELRDFRDANPSLDLNELHDYISRGRLECQRNWSYTFTDAYCDSLDKFLKYNFTESDLDYMSSYSKKVRHHE